MSLRPVSIAIYIPKKRSSVNAWHEQVSASGVSNQAWKDECRGGGRWSVFDAVDLARVELDAHDVLVVQVSGRTFWDLRGARAEQEDLSIEEDPGLPVAHALSAACVGTGAEIGYVCTRYDVMSNDWLSRHYLPVLTSEAWQLLDDVALLYLCADAIGTYHPRPGMDTVNVNGGGLLVFAGTGRHRWL